MCIRDRPNLIKVTSRDPDHQPMSYIKVSGGIFMDMTKMCIRDRDVGAVDLTPWKYRKIAAIGALCLMCCVYLLFSPLGLAG